METIKKYKCFISSPGDCKEEREAAAEIINKINKGVARHLGLNFETFTWEDDVLPDMGENPQEIIDKYIKESNYDIFIGIMKNKFGTPTEKAGSGTEHEFNDALERKSQDSKSTPKILFFFGNEKVDLNNPNIEEILKQHRKVKEFKEKISSNGLYMNFNDLFNFKKLLEEKLNLFIAELSPLSGPGNKMKKLDEIQEKLQKDLKDSLKTYNESSPVWIEPIISSHREIPENPSKNNENRVDISSIIKNPNNIIIKAPSEFGLTSLAHYLKLEAWKIGKTFIYIDAKKTKKHKIVKDIARGSKTYNLKETKDVDCILLDSVCFEENGMMRMIKNICEAYEDIPLIIFNTMDNNFFLKSDEDDKIKIQREFTSYYLLPLTHGDLREIVANYNIQKPFEENSEKVLSKLAKDLETLNMHRTVKNCISILRAGSSIGVQYNPINRTKLLDTILNSIFQEYEVPTYHDEKPDVKDCTFVLGYFCELLVLRDNFEFTDEYFKKQLSSFCTEHYIDLNLNYLLDVLKDNSIISPRWSKYNYFKNSYWVFYFIAHRMDMNEEFKEQIYKNKKYIDFPEIIEFYTGIDRNKKDALLVLSEDLDETLNLVREKVKIPDNLNPFEAIRWTPDKETFEKEEAKIGENVISSGLPNEVKDKYEDKNYNQIRPYNQVINSVMREYSFLMLMRQISATSRALRNSDFVNDPSLKKELFEKITQAWNEISKLLIVLSPLLADKGDVSFEGARFYLAEDDFVHLDPLKKRIAVLLAVPTNVVRFFKDDLYSVKMGPLLIDKAENELNSLIKHELMLLILAERPKKWRETIDKYIVSLNKNSYFLSDIYEALIFNIDYRATEEDSIRGLKVLAKKCRAKHLFKDNNPDMGLIRRLEKLDRGSKH